MVQLEVLVILFLGANSDCYLLCLRSPNCFLMLNYVYNCISNVKQ